MIGPKICPETLLIKHQPTLRNILEERRPQLYRNGSLESRMVAAVSQNLYKNYILYDAIRQATIAKLNSILLDRDVTPKAKTHIYHAIVKSTITYATETWCLKAKTVTKLNSTQMDFWRRSARISKKDKIRNNIIKQKNYCDKFSFRRY